MFNCDKCGLCCKNLDKSDLYKDLDRGDGICKFLHNNLCSIYETRPLKCRVDEAYNLIFYKYMSINEYYKLNEDECNRLKKLEG